MELGFEYRAWLERFALVGTTRDAQALESARADRPGVFPKIKFPQCFSFRMNIHEYQARELFEKYGVAARRQGGLHAGGGGGHRAEARREGDRRQGADPRRRARQRDVQERLQGRRASLLRRRRRSGRSRRKCWASPGDAADRTGRAAGEQGLWSPRRRKIEKGTLRRRRCWTARSSAPVVIASTEGGMDIETVRRAYAGEDLTRAGPSLARPAAVPGAEAGATARPQRRQAKQAAKLFLALYKLSSRPIARWSRSIRSLSRRDGEVLGARREVQFR